MAIQLGDTLRAAYQALVSLMVITGFLPYLYIFGSAWKAGKRISAISGWAITLLAILCSVVPTAEVKNVWLFETKLAVGTAAVARHCLAPLPPHPGGANLSCKLTNNPQQKGAACSSLDFGLKR